MLAGGVSFHHFVILRGVDRRFVAPILDVRVFAFGLAQCALPAGAVSVCLQPMEREHGIPAFAYFNASSIIFMDLFHPFVVVNDLLFSRFASCLRLHAGRVVCATPRPHRTSEQHVTERSPSSRARIVIVEDQPGTRGAEPIGIRFLDRRPAIPIARHVLFDVACVLRNDIYPWTVFDFSFRL